MNCPLCGAEVEEVVDHNPVFKFFGEALTFDELANTQEMLNLQEEQDEAVRQACEIMGVDPPNEPLGEGSG